MHRLTSKLSKLAKNRCFSYCLEAVQRPVQPSDRVNEPEPERPEKRPELAQLNTARSPKAVRRCKQGRSGRVSPMPVVVRQALDATLRSRGAGSARSYASSMPSRKQRAQGKPGARDTRSRAQKCTRRTAGAPERPAFPARWFYGLCRDLPGAEFLWPPSLTDCVDRMPGRASTISVSLTPATGARTTRFCRPQLP